MRNRQNPVRTGRLSAPGVSTFVNRLFCLLDHAGRRHRTCLLAIIGTAIVFRLLLLPVVPVPEPEIHDEFSYLLGADTLASGRLTNPTHPLWEFFETIHVLSRPTYTSKYQPGQALFLAIGQVVAGHPYAGVVLSVALLAGAVFWMLAAWLPGGWALLGGLYTMLLFGVGHYWTDSYWGGAVAALGAAVLLGSYRRITHQRRFGFCWLFGLAAVLLSLSRPYEGGLLVVATGAALVWWAVCRSGLGWKPLVGRIVLPLMLIGVVGLAMQGDYNRRVTGSAWQLPYWSYESQYVIYPAFWALPPFPPRQYGNEQLRAQHEDFESQMYKRIRAMPIALRVPALAEREYEGLRKLFGSTFLLVLGVGLLFWRQRTGWILAGTAIVISAGLFAETWCFQHYMAPLLVVLIGLEMLTIHRLRALRYRGRPFGSMLALMLFVLLFTLPARRLARAVFHVAAPSQMGTTFAESRAKITHRLLRRPERQLVVVRYSPQHSVLEEWVYNRADIDTERIVWARDRGEKENHRLLDYFKDRRAWLLEPDQYPPRLTPYRAENPASSNRPH